MSDHTNPEIGDEAIDDAAVHDDPQTVLPDTSDHDQLAIDAGPEGETLLEIDHVTLRFGGVVALNDVNFSIKRGEILGLIGPNGAGKTTCFNVMTGVYLPTDGEVRFEGRKISGTKPHKINQLGTEPCGPSTMTRRGTSPKPTGRHASSSRNRSGR